MIAPSRYVIDLVGAMTTTQKNDKIKPKFVVEKRSKKCFFPNCQQIDEAYGRRLCFSLGSEMIHYIALSLNCSVSLVWQLLMRELSAVCTINFNRIDTISSSKIAR